MCLKRSVYIYIYINKYFSTGVKPSIFWAAKMQTMTEQFQGFRSVTFFYIQSFHPNLGINLFKTSPNLSEQKFIFQKSCNCPQILRVINLLCPSDRLKPCRADNRESTGKATTFWKGAVIWSLLEPQGTIPLVISRCAAFHSFWSLLLSDRKLLDFPHYILISYLIELFASLASELRCVLGA